MPVLTPIPEKNIHFKVYYEGILDMIGIADAELPELAAMSETVSGSGIAGEIDSPTPGHFGPMSLTLNFRTITGDIFLLQSPTDKSIELRSATQVYDPVLGMSREEGVRIACTCRPKNTSLGSLNVGKSGDASMEFEVTRIKIWIDGVPKLEIDKLRFIYMVNGFDYNLILRKTLLIGV